MNQATEAFLIQLRDLYRNHGVDFAADPNGVSFTNTDESLILAAAGALDSELNVLAEQLPTAIREANPGASDTAIARFIDRYGSGWIVGPGGKPYDLCGEGALDRLAGLLASCEDPT